VREKNKRRLKRKAKRERVERVEGNGKEECKGSKMEIRRRGTKKGGEEVSRKEKMREEGIDKEGEDGGERR